MSLERKILIIKPKDDIKDQITMAFETDFDFKFDKYNKSVLITNEQGSYQFNLFSKKRGNGMMDYVNAC